jgi:hypothetical protein
VAGVRVVSPGGVVTGMGVVAPVGVVNGMGVVTCMGVVAGVVVVARLVTGMAQLVNALLTDAGRVPFVAIVPALVMCVVHHSYG